MPKRQALRPEKRKLQWEMHPQDGKPQVPIEVDRQRPGNEWWHADTVARIPANNRRPSNGLYQSLLNQAPVVIDIPAEPWPLDPGHFLPPPFSGAIHVIQRPLECVPVASSRSAVIGPGEIPRALRQGLFSCNMPDGARYQ